MIGREIFIRSYERWGSGYGVVVVMVFKREGVLNGVVMAFMRDGF